LLQNYFFFYKGPINLFFNLLILRKMATITIQNGDPATGLLDLSDRGHTDAHRGETITWKVRPHCSVKSISNIYVKDPSPINIIWQEYPHRDGISDNWKAVIDRSSPDYSEYNYNIFWVPDGSTEIKKFDPKIAVKPDKSFFTVLVIAVASLFTAIFSVILFNKRRNSK
jgi:hypothetical protein